MTGEARGTTRGVVLVCVRWKKTWQTRWKRNFDLAAFLPVHFCAAVGVGRTAGLVQSACVSLSVFVKSR